MFMPASNAKGNVHHCFTCKQYLMMRIIVVDIINTKIFFLKYTDFKKRYKSVYCTI